MIRVRKTLGAMTVALVVAAGVSATAGPAGATSKTRTTSGSALIYCLYGGLGIAKVTLTMRKSPSLGGAPTGTIPAGKIFNCKYGEIGAGYNLCGRVWNRWEYVVHNDKKGYVPGACVRALD
ncbi:hypothetical protein ACIBO5_50765 [Nonomuraea angiospora]|uniref:hypothetical protein n=1 Tax=Nonomuraea angiospora TaxID=46172 RepID=UPI0029A1D531|nr:hypothetical protein [Nonomuraea angiospora]MDX3099350.1 hypothetical protein [Nonomuraea angiospora]